MRFVYHLTLPDGTRREVRERDEVRRILDEHVRDAREGEIVIVARLVREQEAEVAA